MSRDQSREGSWRLLVRAAAAAFVIAALGATSAAAVAGAEARAGGTGPYAPLDRPGPRLSIPARLLRAALACGPGVARARRDPILLVPGTEEDPGLNFGWNYLRAFARMRWPYCTITLPGHTTKDIQRAGEYIVYALRAMHRRADRKVDILGYSQGGMVPRWALRFWPGTRRLVNAFVALDPSNHGTIEANLVCQQPCSAADWQQRTTAHFIRALNSGAETFTGISYSVIYSRTDDVVIPNFNSSGSSSLHTGSGRIANIAVQQICPNDTSDHFGMGSYDPVGYALAIDAFTHTGPADPARIPRTVCATPFQPGVNPLTFPENYANFFNGSGTSPSIPAEPRLAQYVYKSRAGPAGAA